MQVAADTWEPTVLVWSRIDPSVNVWTSEIGSIRGSEADGFVGALPSFGGETESHWAFARAERELIALHEALQPEPVVTLTVTEDQKRKINLALHTHIDAAVKAVRKARKSGDSLAESLCFSDLTVAIDTLRAIDPSVGDHFTAEWLIGGAR